MYTHRRFEDDLTKYECNNFCSIQRFKHFFSLILVDVCATFKIFSVLST